MTHKGNRKRKTTGGRYRPLKGKKKSDTGSPPTMTKIGETKVKSVRTRGGGSKIRAQVAKQANVLDPKTKKYTLSEIKTVAEAPANRHYVRRNIIVKGAIIETAAGKARVTSRPGQDGTVNAVLV